MKPMLAGVQVWWDARAERERILLTVAIGLAVLWLAVVAVWQPLQAARARLGDQVLRHERALSVLQSQPALAAPLRAPDDRPLNIVITETAAAFRLTIRRLEPEGPRIRVVLDEVPFDAVILWLEAVQRDQGLTVTEMDMTRRPAPGVVNATLALER
jgi:general secretion pathway protein M